jgi:hypothetical protein
LRFFGFEFVQVVFGWGRVRFLGLCGGLGVLLRRILGVLGVLGLLGRGWVGKRRMGRGSGLGGLEIQCVLWAVTRIEELVFFEVFLREAC